MSETKIDGTPVKPVPANIPEELIPVYEWFSEKGKDFLLQLGIVFVAFIAAFSFVKYRASRAEAAAASLLSVNDIAGLEELNGKFGGSKTGPLIRLRLARAYYDGGKFEEAAETFAAFVKSNKGHALVDEARLGLGASLEAQQKFDEAAEAYGTVAAEAPSPAYAMAEFGKARCLAAKGDKDGAKAIVDAAAAALKGTRWESVAESEKELVDRFDGFRKAAGLFDQMSALEGAKAPSDAADIASGAEAAAAAAEEVAAPAEAPVEAPAAK